MAVKVAVLDDYLDTLRTLRCFSKLAGHDVTVWNDHIDDLDVLASRLATTEALILIRERTVVRAELLERLPALQLISQRSAYPHIDIEACTRLGIVVSSNMHSGTPSWSTAELTWGLVLAASRWLPQNVQALKEGRWQQGGIGHTLRGRRLGVYGYGRIGRAVADYGRAFGMDVAVWASEDSRARAAADGWPVAASREAFFEESDVVTIHLRLVDATRGVVTSADLARMRADALFVNTSRAGLVEPNALVAALRAGRPGMAAVDVFDAEPLNAADDPLLSLPNVVATPHLGYVTLEEWELQFSDVFDQVNAYAAGEPIHVVNPDALLVQRPRPTTTQRR
jgi:D-3-phosphoglycerate dehydrogenase / 2-oxoglutarate reductase